MNTLTILKGLVTSTFPTNGTKQISAANLRTFLNTILESLFTPAAAVRISPGPVSTIQAGWHLMDGSEYDQVEYADLFANLGGPSSPYGVGATTFQIPLVKGGQTIIQCGISTFAINKVGTPPYELGAIVTTHAPVGGIAATFKVIATGDSFALKLLTNGYGYVNGEQYGLHLIDGSLFSQMITITSTYNLASTGGEEKHTPTEAEMFRHTHVQDSHGHQVQHSTSGSSGGTGALGGSLGIYDGKIITNNVTPTNQSTGNGEAFNVMNPYVAMNYIIKLY